MGLLQRIMGPLVAKATEGSYRPGPYALPVTGGFLSADAGQYMNWWQLGYDPLAPGSRSAMVEACVSAYAQTIAMCPGDHWRTNTKGGRERVRSSALSRLLRYPNDYQSISDFMLNLVRSLYLEGNAYALALRNTRFEVSELHLMNPRQSHPMVASTGDIFYRLGGNDVIANRLQGDQLTVPERDVLHIRLHSNGRQPYPLVGESPLVAAMGDIAAADAITNQQTNFYLNQARPSAVLSTDLKLSPTEVQQLRDRWNEQSKGLCGTGPGGVPILTAGLKVQPWTTTGKDAEIAEVMKFSESHIALAFRIPLALLGLQNIASMSSTETMMQMWIATGLGFALNHIEESIGNMFELKGVPDEYVEFDTGALLRSAQKDRIEALARAVQGGIYAPNEARELEGLESVKFGDEPRVQQQVVPLSAAGAIPAAPPPPAAPPAPTAEVDAPPPPKKKSYSDDDYKREMRRLISATSRLRRRIG